jgi:hypothetical protein
MKATVGRDLEKILARKRVRRTVEGGDDLVENMPILWVDDVRAAGPARVKRGWAK